MGQISTRQLGLEFLYDALSVPEDERFYPQSRNDAEEIRKAIKLEKEEGIIYEVDEFENNLLDLEIPAWCDMMSKTRDDYFKDGLNVKYHNLMDGLKMVLSSYGISGLASLRAVDKWYDDTKGTQATFKVIDLMRYVENEAEIFNNYPGGNTDKEFEESCAVRDYWIDYYNKTRNQNKTK